MKLDSNSVEVASLIGSVDRNSEINSEILAQMKMLTGTCQDSAEKLERNAQTFIDNQNPSAILGTKKLTSGILIGCAIGLFFTVITGVLSYNYAIKLKYDDYKTKVFADQIQLEKDYKAKIADLTDKEKKLGESKKDLENSLSQIEILKKFKKPDLDKILYFVKDENKMKIAERIASNDVILEYTNNIYQFEKNDVVISEDHYEYVGEITDKKGKKYYHLKHK